MCFIVISFVCHGGFVDMALWHIKFISDIPNCTLLLLSLSVVMLKNLPEMEHSRLLILPENQPR